METSPLVATDSNEYRESAVHGSPGFPMIIYQNDFQTYVKHQVPWHWHEELEFCLVTAGKVQFLLPGTSQLLREGQGIFINRNTLHHMVPVGSRPSYMFSVLVHPNMLSARDSFLLEHKYIEPFIKTEVVPFLVFDSCDNDCEFSRLPTLLRQLEQSWAQKSYGYEYEMKNLIGQIWLLLIRYLHLKKPVSEQDSEHSADHDRLFTALQYIKEHYKEDIRLEHICRAMAVSKSECYRCFRKNLQTTPFSYLLSYRMDKACELLLRSDYSVSDIAQQTGFADNSYFCRLFKKNMGITPLQYRQKQRQGESTPHL